MSSLKTRRKKYDDTKSESASKTGDAKGRIYDAHAKNAYTANTHNVVPICRIPKIKPSCSAFRTGIVKYAMSGNAQQNEAAYKKAKHAAAANAAMRIGCGTA